ncbi:serine hydrolase [Candidatus Cloacimonadota bacterium]
MFNQSRQKKLWLFLGQVLILIFFLTVSHPVYAQLNKSEQINQALSEIVNDGKAPGMIAAIISGDSVIAIGAAGVRKAGTSALMTDKDLVHLGSCGKAMTATMLATLVAEGKLSWETKLIEAIPELKNNIHADFNNITLWQLLTHRAGIPSDPIDWYAYPDKEISERRLSILKDIINYAPAYTDGKFHYSNFGYVVAACMAEQITGLSWEILIRKRLFEPLGMTTAGFGDPVKNKSIDQPWGHKKSWIGNKWKPSRDYYGEVLSPAGRVHCSVEDWAKFISLWLTNENPILKRKYLDKLIEPVDDHFYAGGWGVSEHEWAKGITFNHSGSNEIWYASVLVTPKLNRAFVVATNSCDFGSTPDVCLDITSKMIRMELNHTKERMENSENTPSGSSMITKLPSSWIGTIQMGDEDPKLVFNLFADDTGSPAGNLSVPDKGVKELPLSRVRFEKDSIIMEIATAQARYKGVFNHDNSVIEGIWQEGENSYQLKLTPLTEEIDYDNKKHDNSSSLNLKETSSHFNFYSEEKDQEVLIDLSEVLERNYNIITSHMSTEFEEKINVYIFPDINSFHQAINYPEAPDWVVGAAGRNALKMVTPLNPGSVHSYESLMQAIVHEFAHAVVLNIREHGAIGLPNWLNEGYAYYEAAQLTDAHRQTIQISLAQNKLPTWEDIKQADTVRFGEMGGYELSASIIEFLVQSYGFDKLRQFILEPESAEKIYGVTEEDLENMWLVHLRR